MRDYENWTRYLKYLKQWAVDHDDRVFYGMSPACYDEWLDNEGGEE